MAVEIAVERVRPAGAALIDENVIPLLTQAAQGQPADALRDPQPRAAAELEDRVRLLVRPQRRQDDDVEPIFLPCRVVRFSQTG